MTAKRVTADELTEEQIEKVINTRGFQKMLAYSRLADGIEVLTEQDELYRSMVRSIKERHSSNLAESSVEQVIELFVDEVKTFTDPLADDAGDDVDAADLEDVFVEEK